MNCLSQVQLGSGEANWMFIQQSFLLKGHQSDISKPDCNAMMGLGVLKQKKHLTGVKSLALEPDTERKSLASECAQWPVFAIHILMEESRPSEAESGIKSEGLTSWSHKALRQQLIKPMFFRLWFMLTYINIIMGACWKCYFLVPSSHPANHNRLASG